MRVTYVKITSKFVALHPHTCRRALKQHVPTETEEFGRAPSGLCADIARGFDEAGILD
jgi:hypothetical protein